MNPKLRITPEYQAIVAAPFGTIGVIVIDGRLGGVDFLPSDILIQAPSDPVARQVSERLTAYFADGRHVLDMPISLTGTLFQQKVWQAIRTIPAGQTLTYSALAERVGSGPRAVANACGANPIPLVIPCHRVVAMHGLGGFMQGRETESLSIKQWLLNHERSQSSIAG